MSVGSDVISAADGAQGGNKQATHPPQILAVVVLYQATLSNSPTVPSFSCALDESGLAQQFSLLIYDNSPSQSELPEKIPMPFAYIHDPANGGLSRAYNTALQTAEKSGNDWLLLLDQDTLIDAAYLTTLCRSLPIAAQNPRCAALVPRLLSKDKIISPARVLWGGWLLPVDKTLSGISPWEMMALNSGTLLRTSIVRAIGGFSPIFWLDYLDHWLFNRLHRAGYVTYVLDSALSHELSVRNMANMHPVRYKNILLAEGEFYRCCKSWAENRVYYLRLIARAFRMLVGASERRFFFPTLNHLINQIHRNYSARAEK